MDKGRNRSRRTEGRCIGMDVTMKVSTGRGIKSNLMTHSATLREVSTFEEAMEYFKKELGQFFPPQETLDNIAEKRTRKKADQ